MKAMKCFVVLATMLLTAVSCGAKTEAQKVLVLYYSQTSNTKTVAQEIAKRLGCDIQEITPEKPYDGDFQATINRSMQERQQGVKTALKPIAADLKQYDVIFIGYPIWFGTYAPPIAAFLEQNDLSGKKVVPFCTFGSGGLDTSVKDLKKSQPKAEVLPGYGVRAARMAAVPQEVDQFLKAGGFIKGKFTPLPAFPAQHAVSADESAIFDAAVKDYQMIRAKAKSVAIRDIPNGKEYLFTAVDQGRGGGPQPAGEMKVYVTVLKGESPVFTQVVR